MKASLYFSSFSSPAVTLSLCCYGKSCKVSPDASTLILNGEICRRLRSKSTSTSRLAVSFRAQRGDPFADENKDRNVGNENVQDALVNMARLQAGEVEVREFIDERSKVLTDIAEGAKAEFGRITEDAKLKIDEVGVEVLESCETAVQAFEDVLASARAEFEADELEFEEFERNLEEARNTGLFFKELHKHSKPSMNRLTQEQNEVQVEPKSLIGLTKKSARSKPRAALYVFLVILLAVTLVRTINSGNVSWSRVCVYLASLFFVTVQLIYEKSFGVDESHQEE